MFSINPIKKSLSLTSTEKEIIHDQQKWMKLAYIIKTTMKQEKQKAKKNNTAILFNIALVLQTKGTPTDV